MNEMIRKATTGEIINHWVMALGCILLIITGFGFLFHLPWLHYVFGNFNVIRVVHDWTGVVFTVSLMVSMLSYLPEAIVFTHDDIEWILKGGGYLSRGGKLQIPPQGRLNAGQKGFYLLVALAGLGVALSGFAIWLLPGMRTLILASHFVHNLCFDLFVAAIPAHIYLASLANPGTFRIMVYGTVPVAWARKRHAAWVKEQGF